MISVVVEGATDVPFVAKLCAHAGLPVYPPVIAGGKPNLDRDLPRWANAAKASPYLIVRDLDRDAPCAGSWVAANMPRAPGRWFLLRLAVREVEAWFLADRDVAARCLHVPEHRVPLLPEDESDPKATVVALARRSAKKKIRDGVVPGKHDTRKVGALYETWLIDSAEQWRVGEAMKRSPSLLRARAALVQLRERYEREFLG